jgi:hypothetical protein
MTGTETSHETDADVMIAKLDANGNQLWKKIYGGENSEQGEFVQHLSDGGFIIAGMAADPSNGYDMYIMRTNSSGDSLWSKQIGGFSDDRAFSVLSVQNGSYFVTGWTWSYGLGSGDVYLVKLSESLTGVNGNNTVPESPILGQNFPNPFNLSTRFTFSIPEAANVIIKIYDVSGKEVTTLLNTVLAAGSYNVDWDSKNIQGQYTGSGVYFYKIISGNFIDVKKMVLVK